MKKTRGFFGEFKEFIMRGNVIDMAIGVVIATAFGKITTSLVDNIIMPFIGWIIGDFDLAKFDVTLVPAVMDGDVEVKAAVVLGIGTLLTTIINFLIIGFIVFLIVKGINKMREKAEARKKQEEQAEEDPKPTTEQLLEEILEELKKK
ncbi:MAG: large conductance mechanosensitive channel protein MscL [Clostridia bacterium]|nr:large conductance mechanosensitive channel protein MscL [Clostridia bacterium]